jgi:hypothetical protein
MILYFLQVGEILLGWVYIYPIVKMIGFTTLHLVGFTLDQMVMVVSGIGCQKKIGYGVWKVLGLFYGQSQVEDGCTPFTPQENFTSTTINWKVYAEKTLLTLVEIGFM